MVSIFRKLIVDMREERNMTVEQLSALCGIPSDELNAMETGSARLPFTIFVKILRAFSPSVGSIVLGKHERYYVSHFEDHEKLSIMESNIKYTPLTTGFAGGHMTPYMIEIEKGVSWPDPSTDMNGEYFVYILEGNVEVALASEKYSLAPGDSIYYDTTVGHIITNINEKPAKLLIVLD